MNLLDWTFIFTYCFVNLFVIIIIFLVNCETLKTYNSFKAINKDMIVLHVIYINE